MQSEKYLVELKDIQLSYKNQNILRDINFSISPREIITIIGPNGAGKSTLVKLVAGLIENQKGSMVKKPNLRIGYMPQRLHLDKSLPIKVSRFLSLSNSTKQARYDVLEHISITHLKKQQMHDLSGGELQRVLLAKAILQQPDLLILDEPLQGVDVVGQVELYRLIASLRESLNCAILMVSHDLHLVMAQTDTVICLNQHICCHGKPESVSQHPEYLKLFGKSASEEIAVYTHHHDHHHTLHGDAVACDDDCKHDHD